MALPLVGVIIIFFITCASCHTSLQATLLEDDQQALLQIKLSLQQITPKISSNLSDWVTPANSTNITSPCEWSRITCSSVQNLTRVTGLDLSSLSIAGALNITGFSHLTALSYLNLSHNLFTGSISQDIANCSQLTSLDLSFNSFVSFQASQGLSLLSNLQFLNLGSNNISSTLSQAIPIHCFSLQTLNLSNNSFMGLSSLSWQNCTSLQALDLSYNQLLAGPIPTSLSDNLPSLHNLSISSSNLEGSIPSSLCSKSPLLHLDLSDNKLNGTFPVFLTNCSSLQYLDLSGNSMTGEISSQVGNLTSLELLNLSENLFIGSLPVQLGKLTTLQVLMAGSNSLVGAIPSELSNCKNLTLLDLNTNHLEGSLPDFLSQMLSLQYIVLHSNAFTGPIPSSLFNASMVLRFLDLSNNSLSGSISPLFVNLSSLQFLLLAANNFSGEIPTELGELAALEFLDLSSNQLQGSIPFSIGQLKNLLWLMLAHNYLRGEIPSQLGNCTSLLWLNLRSNLLTGELPAELATMGQDPKGTFTSNARTIHPPKALGECLLLKRWIPENYPPYSFMYDNLDKSRCKSFWIELLSSSPLSSACAQTQGSGGYIQVTNNMLTGPVPSSMQGSQTSILLLGLNLFNGSLPGGLGKLPLRHLNVSHNRLSGTIPSAIADNKCLTLLDLSYNNLSGSLPPSLASLSKLSIFNVSYNPLLTGSIPPVGQLLTFGNYSYVGDPLLCWGILPGMRGANVSFTTLPFCNSSESSSNSTATLLDYTNGSGSKYMIAIVILSFSAALLCGGVTFCVVRRLVILHGMFTHHHDGIFGYSDMSIDNIDESLSGSEIHSTVCMFKTGAAALPFSAVKQLTYAEILLATNNFNEDNVVGCGGFGIVYKAELSDGSAVAVKKLAHYGQQGEREFVAEMQTLGSIMHENLVPLLGCCIFGTEKLLIYKFLCNGSLEDLLHEKEGGAETLTWARRLKIARNCAKALSYLHHECTPVLIHRDMKPSNVLLDEEYNGYLADFGLARELAPGNTHVSTMVAGTLGYVPPEYSQTCRATTKGDVYSFGVVMLELITGRHPICRFGNNNNDMGNDGNLVEWVRGLLRQGRGHEAYHAVVMQSGEGLDDELLKFMELAHACTLDLPEQRPSMKAVASRLECLQDQTSTVQQ